MGLQTESRSPRRAREVPITMFRLLKTFVIPSLVLWDRFIKTWKCSIHLPSEFYLLEYTRTSQYRRSFSSPKWAFSSLYVTPQYRHFLNTDVFASPKSHGIEGHVCNNNWACVYIIFCDILKVSHFVMVGNFSIRSLFQIFRRTLNYFYFRIVFNNCVLRDFIYYRQGILFKK